MFPERHPDPPADVLVDIDFTTREIGIAAGAPRRGS
jgi:hypothetical protein